MVSTIVCNAFIHPDKYPLEYELFNIVTGIQYHVLVMKED